MEKIIFLTLATLVFTISASPFITFDTSTSDSAPFSVGNVCVNGKFEVYSSTMSFVDLQKVADLNPQFKFSAGAGSYFVEGPVIVLSSQVLSSQVLEDSDFEELVIQMRIMVSSDQEQYVVANTYPDVNNYKPVETEVCEGGNSYEYLTTVQMKNRCARRTRPMVLTREMRIDYSYISNFVFIEGVNNNGEITLYEMSGTERTLTSAWNDGFWIHVSDERCAEMGIGLPY